MFSSTMKDDLNYSPTDCCQTFPFPLQFETDFGLETTGREYFDFRAALMVKHNEGLTKTYNRFHDRDHDETEADPEIVAGIRRLRELHATMDRAVLEAYGWHDLAKRATCEFLLDYEEEEDDNEPEARPGRRQKKKPWRYRWPDDFRDEVLARLLELNKERAQQERLTGEATAAAEKAAKPKATRGRKTKNNSPTLPGID